MAEKPVAMCCEAITEHVSNKKIERDDDASWNVAGCCGGGCYVLTEIKFCPYCGTALR